MKKVFNKITLSLFGITCLCGVVSCQKNETTTVEDPNHHSQTTVIENEYFIKDGQTEYSIVYPEQFTTYLKYARDEMVRFVSEATGVKLNSVVDTGKIHDKTSKFISLGNTTLLNSVEIPPCDINLGRDGSRLITIDNTIYIIGGSDLGVLYGVYDFLNDNFNFEAYSPSCYTLNKGVKNVKLKKYDTVDVPDIAFREKKSIQNAISADPDDVMFSYRIRSTDKNSNLILPIHKTSSVSSESNVYHNSFFFIPYDQYGASKPDYFSSGKEQLCFTGHGNEKIVNEMVDICVEKITNSLTWYAPANYPNYLYVQLGVNDTNSFCQCSACRACKAAHNDADSAALIKFLIKVGTKVNEWMAKPENAPYKRDLTYMFLAYQKTLRPPFNNVNNIPSDVTPPEGVKIMPFCALSGFNYGVSFYDSSNLENRNYIELWGTAYPGGWAWSYGGFFHDYLAFFDLYGFYQDYHAYLKKYKFDFAFEQIHDAQRGAESGFHTMAHYVVSKKAWNTSLNAADLIDNYMHAMYGNAYNQMNEILTYFKLWFAKLYKDNNWGSSSIQQTPSYNAANTSIGFVKQALKLFDEAYEAIEIYSDDPVVYQRYLDHIDQEWLFIGKTIISCYQENFNSDEIYDIKVKFRDIVNRLGVAELVEFVSITDFMDHLFD